MIRERERESPPSVPFPYYVVYCGYIYIYVVYKASLPVYEQKVVYEASLPVYEQKEWERGKRREHFIILRIITHSLVFLSALFILYSYPKPSTSPGKSPVAVALALCL